MTGRISLLAMLVVWQAVACCSPQTSRAAEPAIGPGDPVLTVRAAEVKAGDEVLATVPAGTELQAADVDGPWISVVIQRATVPPI